jgi:hypothetical protein
MVRNSGGTGRNAVTTAQRKRATQLLIDGRQVSVDPQRNPNDHGRWRLALEGLPHQELAGQGRVWGRVQGATHIRWEDVRVEED